MAKESAINAVAAWITHRTITGDWDDVRLDDDVLLYVSMDKKERIKHIKIEEYVNLVVLKYLPDDFKSHFRMSRCAVEELCLELKFKTDVTPGRPPISRLSSVLLSLWTLATQETYREISDRFGISKSNAYSLFIYVCKLICKLEYIKFPTGEDFRRTVEGFNNLRNISFPSIAGCVDGSHIEIKAPALDNSFYNRKGSASVILQGIVDSRYEFTDVFCGYPGSSHDARVWQNSPIYQIIIEEHIIPDNYHLLGDSAYPLHTNLMVPFKDNGHLTQQQKRYNQILSSHRVVVEQAFGRLYEVFRRLKYLNILNLANCKYIIIAACMLHNYIIRKKEGEIFQLDENAEEDSGAGEAQENRRDRAAKLKRDQIMISLNN